MKSLFDGLRLEAFRKTGKHKERDFLQSIFYTEVHRAYLSNVFCRGYVGYNLMTLLFNDYTPEFLHSVLVEKKYRDDS